MPERTLRNLVYTPSHRRELQTHIAMYLIKKGAEGHVFGKVQGLEREIRCGGKDRYSLDSM